MSSITFTAPNGGDPSAQILQLKTALTPTVGDCLYAGHVLRTKVYKRTLAGTDVDGVAFSPYTEKYAARKSKELGHGRIDLFGIGGKKDSFHMLSAVTVRAGGVSLSKDDTPPDEFQYPPPETEILVGVTGAADVETRARVHNEGSTRMPTRHWLGANADDINLMEFGIAQRMILRARSGK